MKAGLRQGALCAAALMAAAWGAAGWAQTAVAPHVSVPRAAEASAPAPAASARAAAPAGGAAAVPVRQRMKPVSEAEGTTLETGVGDSLWEIAGAATLGAGPGLDRNQAMVAIFRRNQDAFPLGNLHRVERRRTLVIPPWAQMRREAPREAAALVAQHRAAFANRSEAPAPLYALPGEAAGRAASGAGADAASAAHLDPPASVAASQPGVPPRGEVPWWTVVLVSLFAAGALWLVWRARGPRDAAADARTERERATRAFVDSRLELEDQLESQLQEARESRLGSRPLYASFEPDDADEPTAASASTSSANDADGSPAQPARATLFMHEAAPTAEAPVASGEALALALTVAHAYADVGRPEAARAWLRAIDSHGGASF